MARAAPSLTASFWEFTVTCESGGGLGGDSFIAGFKSELTLTLWVCSPKLRDVSRAGPQYQHLFSEYKSKGIYCWLSFKKSFAQLLLCSFKLLFQPKIAWKIEKTKENVISAMFLFCMARSVHERLPSVLWILRTSPQTSVMSRSRSPHGRTIRWNMS